MHAASPSGTCAFIWCSGGLQAGDSGLGVFVAVIVLYLAEIPVVVGEDPQELVGIAMIGETYVMDGAGTLLFIYPFQNPYVLEFLPLGEVCELVHQVIVDIVCPQPLQLLVEVAVECRPALHQVLGEFGCDMDSAAYSVALEDLPKDGLASWIYVRRIVVVDASAVGSHDLFFSLLQVDAATLAGEAHASVTEDGEPGAFSVLSVLHGEWIGCLCDAKLSFFQYVF